MEVDIVALQAVTVQLKEKVLIAERALLYVMGFDTDVIHPYAAAEEILSETEVLRQAMVATETGELELLLETPTDFNLPSFTSKLIYDLCTFRCRIRFKRAACFFPTPTL